MSTKGDAQEWARIVSSYAEERGLRYEPIGGINPKGGPVALCPGGTNRLTGELVALATGTGKVRWRKEIGPSESSPLLWRGLLYVGDWRGIVYCYVARTGELKWTYRTKGEIKGALALASERLFVASYDHSVYALDPLTGKPFPNGIIPANRIDPNMQKMMNIFPLPNAPDVINGGFGRA